MTDWPAAVDTSGLMSDRRVTFVLFLYSVHRPCNPAIKTHTHTMSSNKRRTKDRLRYYVITKYKQVHSDSNDCNRATIQQQQHDAHFLIPITTRSQVTLQATQWGTRPMYVYIYTPILRDRNRMQSTCRERDLHKPISPSENWKQELGTTRMYSFLLFIHVPRSSP